MLGKSKTCSPKWWINGDLLWWKIKSHLNKSKYIDCRSLEMPPYCNVHRFLCGWQSLGWHPSVNTQMTTTSCETREFRGRYWLKILPRILPSEIPRLNLSNLPPLKRNIRASEKRGLNPLVWDIVTLVSLYILYHLLFSALSPGKCRCRWRHHPSGAGWWRLASNRIIQSSKYHWKMHCPRTFRWEVHHPKHSHQSPTT